MSAYRIDKHPYGIRVATDPFDAPPELEQLADELTAEADKLVAKVTRSASGSRRRRAAARKRASNQK